MSASACFAGVATSHRARKQFRHLLRGKTLICQVLPFPVKKNQRSPEKETYAMEMRQLYALIIVTGLLLTALHGGWNISDISVLFVFNLGN